MRKPFTKHLALNWLQPVMMTENACLLFVRDGMLADDIAILTNSFVMSLQMLFRFAQ